MDFKLDPKRFMQMFQDWYASKDLKKCPWIFYIDMPMIPLLDSDGNADNLQLYTNKIQLITDLESGQFCDICIALLKLKSYTKLRKIIKDKEGEILGPCPCNVLGCEKAIERLILLKYFTRGEK